MLPGFVFGLVVAGLIGIVVGKRQHDELERLRAAGPGYAGDYVQVSMRLTTLCRALERETGKRPVECNAPAPLTGSQ